MYTFDADSALWDTWDQRWIYPDGPQRRTQESEDFLDEINSKHELWTQPLLNAGSNKVVTETSLDNAFTFQKKEVGFKSHLQSVVIGEASSQAKEDIDDQDRNDRLSVNFSKMLADFVEKAWSTELREKFFCKGGIGERWGQNKEMMESFGGLFETTRMKDKISLCSESVKDYPRHHFETAYDVYHKFMSRKSSLRAEAVPFIPGQSAPSGLARVSPKKICGVYQIPERETPPKPSGIPPPPRPSSDKREVNVGQTITDLEKRLQALIALSEQPVCIATPL